MSGNYEDAMRTALAPLVNRLDSAEQALAAIKRPQSKSGLSYPDVVAWMQANNQQAAVGGANGLSALPGFRPNLMTRGCGIGPALRAIADIESRGQYGNNATRETLEKEWGFQTLERYKEYGMKSADGTYVNKAALAEGSGVTGGYVVPPQFSQRFLQLAIEESFIRQRATVMPMTSRTLTIPSLDVTTAQAAGVTAFLGGIYASWQPEAATINETEPTFRQTELTAWDLVCFTVASNQLLADNAIALDSLLTQLFPLAVAWYTEYAFLRGLGASNSMPLGVLNAPATIIQPRNETSKFKLRDAAAMIARLYVRSWNAATTTWVIHQTVIPQLIEMVDFEGTRAAGIRSVWMNPAPPSADGPAANRLPMSLFGMPIFITEKSPPLGSTGDVMLVDWSHYIIGDRMDLQIDVSPHVRFLTNQMVWRLVARIDGKPWLNNKVTLADGTNTVSPYVVLKDATS